MISFFKRIIALISRIFSSQKVELGGYFSEREILEIIRIYEEYGFIHIKTKQNFGLKYKIYFIKKQRFN